MFIRTYKKVMGIALSAALAVTSPSFSVLAQEQGKELTATEENSTGNGVSAGNKYGQGNQAESGEESGAEDTATNKKTGSNYSSQNDGYAEDAQDPAGDTGSDDVIDEDSTGDDAAAEDATDENADAEDEEAEDVAEKDLLPGAHLYNTAKENKKAKVEYNTNLSFPDGFEGFVDDEAAYDYGEEEVLLGSPVSGAVNLDFTGTFFTLSAEEILKQINDIRYEACAEGVYFDPYDRELTMDDYHPLQWSAALEHCTRIRAIESAMTVYHETLGGGSIYEHADEIQSGFWRARGENLAWNNNHDSSGITFGINQFYSEKSKYIETRTNSAETGHYVNLINPYFRYVGVGCCMMDNAPRGWNTIAMQLGATTDSVVESGRVDTTKDNRTGRLTYSISVDPQYFEGLTINGDDSVPKGQNREYSVAVDITVPNYYGVSTGTYEVSDSFKNQVAWSSSDKDIFTVNGGLVTGLAAGSATLNAELGSVLGEKELVVTVALEDIAVSEQGSSDALAGLDINRNEVQNMTLAVSYLPSDTTDERKATFTSSDTSIVTVDQTGNLTFKKPGTATITVSAESSNKDMGTDGTITKTISVRVTAPVTGISLDQSDITLNYTGDTPPTAALKVNFEPADTEYEKKATFTSSDDSIAKVDANGTVTAVAGGEAVITASAYGFTASCDVEVIAPLKALNISDTTERLYIPDTNGSIEVQLDPYYTSDKEVVFTSPDPAIVKFAGLGDGKTQTVTAENGIATARFERVSDSNTVVDIEVSAADGKFTKTAQVIIAKPTESVTMSLDGKELSTGEVIRMDVGTKIEPEAVALPADAYDTAIEWTSSDETVATVSSEGLIVALKQGETVITATSHNAKEPVANSFKVKVARRLFSFSLSRDEVSLYTGDSYALTAFVSPEGVTDDEGRPLPVTYKSWNPSVATVSPEGVITAVSEGEAKITASVNVYAGSFDELEDACVVTVLNDDRMRIDEYGNPEVDTPYPGDDENGIWLADETFDDLKFYTGKPITQGDVRIYYGKMLLTQGTDYTISYKNNVKPAYYSDPKPPQMIVKLKGQYSGSRTYLFSIDDHGKEKNLALAKATVSPSKVLFNGEDPDIKVSVKLNGKELPADKYEWRVCEKGSGELIIRVEPSIAAMSEGYWGYTDVKLKVTGDRPMKNVIFDGVSDQIYSISAASDGGVKLPDLELSYNGEPLAEGEDYKLTYSKNTKAGTATVTAKGMGRYSGSAKKTFRILPNDGTAEGYKLTVFTKSEVSYTKGGVTPNIDVKDKAGQLLTSKTDYTVSVLNKSNLAPGTMTFVVTGKGNYKGYKSKEISVKVTGGDLSAVTMTVQDKAYTTKKNGWKSSVKLTDVNGKALQAGKDYEKEVIYSFDGETADGCPVPGTIVYVTVMGKGFYEKTSLTGSYRIYEKGIDKMKVVIDSAYYTGRPVEPGKDRIHIYASAADAKIGKEIENAGDYYQIVGYSNNIKAGTAKITLKGRGILGGTKTFTFKIQKMPYNGR